MTRLVACLRSFIPPVMVAAVWLGQGILALGYLMHVGGVNKRPMVMHLVIVLATLILCLVPFTFQAVLRLPGTVRRVTLAVILGTVQFAFLCFYMLDIGCIQLMGTPPTMAWIVNYVPQLGALLPFSRLQLAFIECIPVSIWLIAVWVYYRAGDALQTSLGSMTGEIAACSSSARNGARIRMGMMLALALLAGIYIPTRAIWAEREPIHQLWGTNSGLSQMVPEGMRGVWKPEANEYLANLPVNQSPVTPRNLILITVDALRSDQMGIYGANVDDTPFLSSLYRAGKLKRIDSAYSVCSYSFCGLLGTLSSSYWHQLNPASLPLSDVLSHYGYQTRFLLSGDHSHFLGLRNFYGSAIDEYRDGSTVDAKLSNDDSILMPWLKNVAWSSKRPTFTEIHLMSVHYLGIREAQFGRWQPTKPAATGLIPKMQTAEMYRNNYLNGILQADDKIRQIFQILKDKGVLDGALVIITADHGENLGDHGGMGHGGEPYESVARIPMLIYDQDGSTYPERQITSQVDVAPTFLQAIGAPIPGDWAGIPLQLETKRSVISVASFEVSGIVAQFGAERYKYLIGRRDGTEELYELGTPNAEEMNLARLPSAYPILEKMRALHLNILRQRGSVPDR